MAEIVINDLEPIKFATAAGGETGFSFGFPIFDDDDLVVLEIDTSENVTTLTNVTDYTVGGVGVATGGSIAFDLTEYPSGATAGYRYVLYRDLAVSRTSDFLTGGDFKAETVNRELDKLVMMIQQNELDNKRALHLQKADAEDEIVFKVEDALTRANKFLKFDANGNVVEAGATASDIENAASNAAAAEAALDAFTDIYLGAKAADPTLDNDGDALADGALYFNTTSDQFKYYTGSTWAAAGANTDELAKVSSNDTGAGYLASKIVAGSGITITELNDGGAETLEVTSSAIAFETGDMLPTFKGTKSGWLLMNGETIGDASSGADNESSTYEDLFEFLWDNVGNDYAAVSTGRGASAAADWAAGKTIVVPDMRGRGFVGTGQGTGLTKDWASGEGDGDETKTIAETNLPAHTHGAGSLATSSAGSHSHTLIDSTGTTITKSGGSTISSSYQLEGGLDSGNNQTAQTLGPDGAHTHVISGTSGATGSGTALDVQNPMRAANWMIKI